MSVKKKAALAILALFALFVNAFLLTYPAAGAEDVTLTFTLRGSQTGDIQVYYGDSADFSPKNQETVAYEEAGEAQELSFTLPSDAAFIRIDFGSVPAEFVVTDLSYRWREETWQPELSAFSPDELVRIHDVEGLALLGGGRSGDWGFTLTVTGEDPFVTAEAGPSGLKELAASHAWRRGMLRNAFFTCLFDGALLLLFLFRKRFSTLPVELWQNRTLILQLARNDFKTKYAGSVFGIIWAFIQPTVTVVVYWFVFQIGLGAGNKTTPEGVTYAFVLWLIAGLVPWFFFQDTLVGGTNALLEYTYLVKKVVFKISILPIVKEISALFVHLFFIALMMLLYILGGHFPDIHWIQVFYYSGCLFLYCLGVSFATCSIVVFFRDLSQIISIIIQVQVWLTPIMWDFGEMAASGRMPGWLIPLFKLNPMFYIVNGYRDSMMNGVWFFERLNLTVYFWAITGVFFVVGAFIFKRLKGHFADTL